MERTHLPEPHGAVYDSQQEPIVLSKYLLDQFLKEDKPGDLIALYCFYYYTAKWQRTNKPKCTTIYTANGLHWAEERVRTIKKELIRLQLIEDICCRNSENRIIAWYIKVNFIWSSDKNHPKVFPQGGNSDFHPKVFPEGGNFHSVENHEGNALSSNNINVLNINNINADKNIYFSAGEKLLHSSQKNKSKISSNKSKNEIYLPVARYLAKIIKTNKNITTPTNRIQQWADEIRKLSEISSVDIQRIKESLKWYKKNIGGQYIPVIESGKSLRDKFIKLEAAMERQNKPQYNKPKQSLGSRQYITDNTIDYDSNKLVI